MDSETALPTFRDLKLHPQILEGISSIGFNKPTPVQQAAIPVILEERDLIACAQTGTGKTAAFMLPLMHHILNGNRKGIQALVIVPTRELAIQIDESVQGLAYFTDISSIAIYGGNDGSSFDRERRALSEGADIIITTPGRFISHLNMGYVGLASLRFLVLDEADRMLDMGFQDDLQKIFKHLPAKRCNLFFSATMPPKIRTLCKQNLHNPVEINLSISKPAAGVEQLVYMCYDEQKTPLLKSILSESEAKSIVLFASRKETVKNLYREFKKLKLSVGTIHSDLEQNERNDVMREFKSRKIRMIVATDIISRGIDIDDIGLVINYDVPMDAEDYIHRVGRTARAENTGRAVTFVNPADMKRFSRIEDLIGSEIPRGVLNPELGNPPEYNPAGDKKPGKSRNKKGGFKKRFNKKRTSSGSNPIQNNVT
jgi:superfamily II DNA/RNA helicase